MIAGRKEFHPREMNDTREMLGAAGHEIVNCTSGDAVPTNLFARYAEVDTDGIIKFDYINAIDGKVFTLVIQVYSSVIIHYPNISKVYQYYTGSTACTATVFLTDGSAQVTGLRLVY
jgi:hypothetical protein